MNHVRMLGLLLFISFQVQADIIYAPHTDMGAAVSIEGVGALEKPFTRHNTAVVWDGFFREMVHGNPGLFMTIGLRVGYSKLLQKKQP